jgi:hypothetical protein
MKLPDILTSNMAPPTDFLQITVITDYITNWGRYCTFPQWIYCTFVLSPNGEYALLIINTVQQQ